MMFWQFMIMWVVIGGIIYFWVAMPDVESGEMDSWQRVKVMFMFFACLPWIVFFLGLAKLRGEDKDNGKRPGE